MDGTNKRLEGIIRDVQELKTSSKVSQERVEEMGMGCKEIETKIM